LEDHDLYQDPWPWGFSSKFFTWLTQFDNFWTFYALGGEPIYRNNKFCGYTTSTAYGYSLEKQVNGNQFEAFYNKTKFSWNKF
jgi:hypothetical protein